MWASGICSRVILYIYSEFRLSGPQELPVPRNKKSRICCRLDRSFSTGIGRSSTMHLLGPRSYKICWVT